MELILGSQALFLLCIGIFSLLVGSFLNVVIWRLPTMIFQSYKAECYRYLEITPTTTEPKIPNLIYPHSACVHCHSPIKVIDNIPILSFILLRGRCRNCHQRISRRYPLIEALTLLLSLITAYVLGPTLQMGFALFLTWSLLVLSVIDLEHQILPDDITLPLLWGGLGINLFSIFCSLSDAVIGAIAGYLFLWAIYWIFKMFTGKEGIGYGDFKLLALLGAWTGWQTLPIIILISASCGTIIGLCAIAFKIINRNHPIPFGPFLALGGWIVLLYYNKVTLWYGLLG